MVFSWEVAPGKHAEFERWAHGIEAVAAAFPGQQGVTWLKPEGDSTRYHAVVRFADTASLQQWMESPERAEWQDRVQDLARDVGPQTATTGLEAWFDVPRLVARPPARWKMSLTTILGVYPFALLYDAVFAEYFREWPLSASTMVFPLFLAPLLTYAVMPGLSRVLRRWLYPGS